MKIFFLSVSYCATQNDVKRPEKGLEKMSGCVRVRRLRKIQASVSEELIN